MYYYKASDGRKLGKSLSYQLGLYTWVKNEVRHGHFKSCRSLTWAFIKTVNYLDPCGDLIMLW